MPDAVTSQTLIDGEAKAVMRFTNNSDGTGEGSVKKVDVSTLRSSPTQGACTGVKIERVKGNVWGAPLSIEWSSSSANVAALHCEGDVDYDGPVIPNNASNADGDVDFTFDATAAADGDGYDVTLYMRKTYG